jgi:hypothetical protein
LLYCLALLPGLCLYGWGPPPPPPPGKLLLSNQDYGPSRVEAVITANPYCGVRAAGYVATSDFVLSPNATRIIVAPPGADVCWRRENGPDEPRPGQWSDWARAFVAGGKTVDSTI